MRVLTVGVWRWRGKDGTVAKQAKQAKQANNGNGSRAAPLYPPFIDVSVHVRKTATVGDVRKAVAAAIKCDPEKLFMTETYIGTHFQILGRGDGAPLAGIANTDVLSAYEVHPFSGLETELETEQHCVHAQIVQRNSKGTAIGRPLVTSFERSLTFTELRWHVWGQVKRQFDRDEVEGTGHSEKELAEKLMPLEYVREEATFSETTVRLKRDLKMPEADDIEADDERVFAKALPPNRLGELVCLNITWPKEWTALMTADLIDETDDHESVEALGRQGCADITLDDMLKSYGKPEKMTLDDCAYCRSCKENQCALKTIKLRRLPNILVMSFTRFKFRSVNRTDKQSQFVSYPVDGLDMAKYGIGGEGSAAAGEREGEEAQESKDSKDIYDLCGVILHHGRAGFGHYVAYARSWQSNGGIGAQGEMDDKFYCYDDGSVDEVPADDVVAKDAYCLFYRKRVFE